jgi:hypothetical protein
MSEAWNVVAATLFEAFSIQNGLQQGQPAWESFCI